METKGTILDKMNSEDFFTKATCIMYVYTSTFLWASMGQPSFFDSVNGHKPSWPNQDNDNKLPPFTTMKNVKDRMKLIFIKLFFGL